MCNEPIDIPRKTQIIGWLWLNQDRKYFFIRLFMTIFVFGVFLYSFVWYAIPLLDTQYTSHCCAQYWVLELTHWALSLELVYFILITYLHGQVLFNKSFDLDSKCNNAIFWIMKFFYCGALQGSVIIAIVYWPIFWSGKTEAAYLTMQILQHGITAIIIVIEYVINLNQLKYKYSAFAAGVGILYIFMYIIHWASDGATPRGPDTAPYSAADFDKNPGVSAGIFFMVLLFVVLGNCVFTKLKIWIIETFDEERTNTDTNSEMEKNTAEMMNLVEI